MGSEMCIRDRIILMYLGRVGGLTLIYAVLSRRNRGNAKLPLEKITVG